MTERIVHKTMDRYLSLEVSEDKRKIGVFTDEHSDKIIEFNIEDIWDMVRDVMATINAGPIELPGLFRRKGEAIAGLKYTHSKLFGTYLSGEED